MSNTVTVVAQWGNSLAVRLGKASAQANLHKGDKVEVEVTPEGYLLLKPVKREVPRYTLKEILQGVTPETVGPEVDWGPSMGNETW